MRRTLGSIEGVFAAEATRGSKDLCIDHDPEKAPVETILARLADAGHSAKPK